MRSEHHKKVEALPKPVVCVECGASVPYLVRDYGKGNFRLATCRYCHQVADPYVEFETILLFIDLMLMRPQVYRHVLHNLTTPFQKKSIGRLFIILTLLDLNAKAYLVELQQGVVFQPDSMYSSANAKQQNSSGFRLSQFSFQLALQAALENLVYLVTLFLILRVDLFGCGWNQQLKRHGVVNFLAAIGIGSFGKLFVLFSVIWEYHWTFLHVIASIVVISHVLGLQLLLNEYHPDRQSGWQVWLAVGIGIAMRFATQLVLFHLGNSTLFYVLL